MVIVQGEQLANGMEHLDGRVGSALVCGEELAGRCSSVLALHKKSLMILMHVFSVRVQMWGLMVIEYGIK